MSREALETRLGTAASVEGASARPPDSERKKGQRAEWQKYFAPNRLSALYLWIIFVVVFGALHPNLFFTQTTFKLVFTENVIVGVLALAFLIPLVANTYDLSIGAVMSLGLLLVNWFGVHTGVNAALAGVIAVAACAAVGFVSGFVVVKLKVNSFIATLGVAQIVTGVVLYISQTKQITGAFSNTYKLWGRREVLGVPILVIYLLIIAVVLWFVLEHTAPGRYLFATGGNEQAARLAGVPTDRAIWVSLVASGAIAGFAGVIYSMKIATFSTTVGPGYLFPAVTAVFFGASQFQKRPNVWGTVIALYALAFGIKGLQLQFTDGAYWIEPLFQGTTLILAVSLAARQGHGALKRHRAPGTEADSEGS